MSRVAFVALGTRGDVEPLAVLANGLAHSGEQRLSILFLTHAAHAELMTERRLAACGVSVAYVLDAPSRGWAGTGTGATALPAQDAAATRAFLVAALAGFFPSAAPQRLVVVNLFALEAFHIAEALGVACLAASPAVVPFAAPGGLRRALLAVAPALVAELESTDSDSGVRWADVAHWLWPVLDAERWAEFRCGLGLAPLPFLEGLAARIARPGQRDSSVLPMLPPPPRLLYGVSPSLTPIPSHWPSSVTPTGLWLPKPPEPGAYSPPPEIAVALARQGGPVVVVSLGTPAAMGLLPPVATAAATIAAACVASKTRAIVLAGGGGAGASLAAACRSVGMDSTTDAVPFSWLLPQCAAVMHHGGAGTAATAAAAGRPQIIWPFVYDQFGTAESMTHLGLGCTVDLTSASATTALATALKAAVEPAGSMARRAAIVGAEIESEADGVAVAVGAIRSALAAPPPPPPVLHRFDCLQLPNGMGVAVPRGGLRDAAHVLSEVWGGSSVYVGAMATAALRGWGGGDGPVIVVDVGAHVGLFALSLACRPRGRRPEAVYCVEPAGAAFDALCCNLALVQDASDPGSTFLTAVRCAVGVPGCRPLTVYPAMPGNSTLFPMDKDADRGWYRDPSEAFAGSRVETVAVRPLGNLFADWGLVESDIIDLLKIDVEGAEEEALASLDDASWPAVRRAAIEVHRSVADGTGEKRCARLEAVLRGRGFHRIVVARGGVSVMMYAARD